MVFQSNKYKDDIIAIINAVDKKKNPVIVPIRINGKGRKNFVEIDANILKSTYGKKNINDYIKNNVQTEDMLLIQNKIIRKLENLK